MSNLAEIKRIEEAMAKQMAEWQKQLNALKASALTITIPAATIQLNEGERYAGAILKEDGTVDYHVILLPGEIETTWADAGGWAAGLGGQLPNRREQSLLYTNLKGEFQSAWYWSCEQHSGSPDFAWMQGFSYGCQDTGRKSFSYRARAVRRLVI